MVLWKRVVIGIRGIMVLFIEDSLVSVSCYYVKFIFRVIIFFICIIVFFI